MIWPKSGWRRSWQYTMYRVGRLPGTGYAIAGGFAWGAAMSFTPLIGLHFSAVDGRGVADPVQRRRLDHRHGRRQSVDLPVHLDLWLYKAGTAMGFGATGVDADAMDFAGLFGQRHRVAARPVTGRTWPTPRCPS
jgi:hypothetical protein